jgi:ABC-type transport system involved in cytochrome c biogenesis permease subunit
MLKLSQYSLVAGVMMTSLALVCYILVLAVGRSARRAPALAYAGGGGAPAPTGSSAGARASAPPVRGLAMYGTYLSRLALVFLTATLVFRAVHTGHGPFANQYEFSVAFAWGMVAAYVYFEQRFHVRTLALFVLPIAVALTLYAMTVGATAVPLVPALQNNLLLSVHVALAILAYGAFSVACAAGLLYLIQPEGGRPGLPKPALLDEIAYRSVVVAYPLLTLVIILGAVWAEIAWGTYWSWDPKETASLFTWLIYGAYLHARVVHGWRGRRASWLLMLGFAAVLFTFFGNLFFGGLHSYAG